MEAVGAVSAIVSLVEIVGQVSKTAVSFMRDVKDARVDMIQVRKELFGLSTILEVIQEDFASGPALSAGSAVLRRTHEHIEGICRNCVQVVRDIDQVIQNKQSRLTSVAWVTSGHRKVEKLKADLRNHINALEVSLQMISYVGIKDIKEDVSASRQGISELLRKTDLILESISGARNAPRGDHYSSAAMLGSYLEGLKDDAETVLSSVDYQREDSFTIVDQDSEPDHMRGASSPSTVPSIIFKNSQDRQFCIPLEACRTWEDMSEIVKHSFSNTEDTEFIDKGQYDLISGNSIFLPRWWETLIQPGLEIKMVSRAQTSSISKYQNAAKASPRARTAQSAGDKLVLKFKDAIGRKYILLWRDVSTWEGMEHVIKNVCENVEGLRAPVWEGLYDVVIAEGTKLIDKSAWDAVVRPGMSIAMLMWP
ncbi:hypothetical protein M406DRAFT_66935 [Cryphonectria parasitica EP155]|uniref:Ubiquitin-like domain-containing protein n=1 Tax=Cryphonectria parasitica (strain ATCC 38755 / EP155) TaxID=660469 RepID=A0A9P4YBX5_CRYP1|nr:uncharacterized protein M406DRAFT_66935 [Cryphonectria parasitica EP155]KAF3770536.1 hypothetical protein M406DRAFT_66935 [Cryphonectria parasitica EP155]